jgi:L-ascorbate metabolism protein UlaG (beta-lactamase superfamily)
MEPKGGNVTNHHPRPSFTYLGHATVRCNLPGGEVLLIDPWVMGNPACPDELKRFELCTWLESKGVENCSGMNLGGTQEVLGLAVSMVRADHSCGLIDDGQFLYGGAAAGYVVKLGGGYTFYHAGDTALFSDMQLIAELYRPELAFLPIGDLYTMDPQQAARACRYLGVRKVVPIHWGTFPVLTGTPQKLIKALEDLGVTCEVIALQPGDSY